MELDYTLLRLIWWGLMGLLFWGFALMDGFDLGVATLLPFVGKTDLERRILINTIGPVWEGNQMWLILGAGAIFAAWPPVYALLFTWLYLPLFAVLCTLILRPIGFKFRSKLEDRTWRHFWDGCLFLAGLIPAFSFGLVLGNLVNGLPFHFDAELRMHATGPMTIFNPFAVCSGLLWVVLCTQRGVLYLLMKVEGNLRSRLRVLMGPLLLLGGLLFCVLLGLWRTLIPHYEVFQASNLPSNPLAKIVYVHIPEPAQTFIDWLPLTGSRLCAHGAFVGLSVLVGILVMKFRRAGLGFIVHSVLLGVVIACIGLSHFPLIIPSTTHPAHSLTLWDASSSAHALKVLLIAALIFIPIIIAYTSWAYRVMRGPVRQQWIQDKSGEIY